MIEAGRMNAQWCTKTLCENTDLKKTRWIAPARGRLGVHECTPRIKPTAIPSFHRPYEWWHFAKPGNCEAYQIGCEMWVACVKASVNVCVCVKPTGSCRIMHNTLPCVWLMSGAIVAVPTGQMKRYEGAGRLWSSSGHWQLHSDGADV